MRLRPLVLDVTGAPMIVCDDETQASFTIGEVPGPSNPAPAGLIVSPPEAPPLIVAPPSVRIVEVQNPATASQREQKRRAEALRRLKDPGPERDVNPDPERDVKLFLDGIRRRDVL